MHSLNDRSQAKRIYFSLIKNYTSNQQLVKATEYAETIKLQ